MKGYLFDDETFNIGSFNNDRYKFKAMFIDGPGESIMKLIL